MSYYNYFDSYAASADDDEIQMDLSATKTWTDDFELINPGKYHIQIANAEKKFGRESGRPYIQCRYRIVEPGKFQKRLVFDRFFIWADKPEVGKERLKSLRASVGLNPNTGGKISELLDKELIVSIRIKPRADNGQPENVVSGYHPLHEGKGMQQAPMAPQAPQAPTAPAPMAQAQPQAQQPVPQVQPSEGYPF